MGSEVCFVYLSFSSILRFLYMFKCTLGPLGAIALLKIKTHTGTIINVDMGKGTLRALVAHSAQKMRTRQRKNID